MAQETEVRPVNPCCERLQKKLSKLQQKLVKAENGRNILKEALGIYEGKYDKFEAENLKLKKEVEQERMRAEDERERRIDESASQVTLENEISSLRSEISSLKQKGSSGAQHVGDEVVILQARISEGEKEIFRLKENLETEQMRAENEKKRAEEELRKANEALNTAKAEIFRAEKLQADDEKEMKLKESTIRVPLENEISSLKSQMTVLQQQVVSGAQDVNKDATFLQDIVSEQKAEIARLIELLQEEKNRSNYEKKKDDDEKCLAQEVLAEKERALNMIESDVRMSLENEISSLKSQITLLQQQLLSGAQNVNKEIILLQERVSVRETEINQLKELLHIEKDKADSEKKKADEERKKSDDTKCWAEKMLAENEREMNMREVAIRVPLENEITSLKSHITLLEQQALAGAQDVSNSSGAQDRNKEKVLVQERLSEREAEINRLNELLQKEKKRADSEKKKANEEKKKTNTEKSRAEKMLADKEREVKENEQAIRLGLETEISALKSQIHLLQQELAARDEKKEVTRFESQVSEKEAEINQLKKLLEKERKRAESEKKNAEAGKKKVNEAQKNAKTEKSRAEEEKRLAAIERKKAEEAELQLERLKVQVDDLKEKLVTETSKFQQANEKLELEKQKANKDKKRADMQMAVAEEKNCLKCEKVIKKLKDVKEKAKREKERAGSEMRKAEEQGKLAEAFREKARAETSRCEQLAHDLDNNRCKTEELEKKILELTSSRTLLNCHDDKSLNTDTKRIKLLRKELRLEKMQAKHAKRVASFEKDRSCLLQQQIWRIKDEFSQVKDHLDMLDICFLHKDAGIIDREKTCNVSRRGSLNLKRKFLDEEPCQVHLHSGNEHLKSCSTTLDAYNSFKHGMQCTAPLLSSKDLTKSITGIDSKLVPLLRGSKRTLLHSSATNCSMASFSDKTLVGSQERAALSIGESDKLGEGKTNLQQTVSRLSNDISKSIYNKNSALVAENTVRCPLRINAVGHKVGHENNRTNVLDAVESIENLYCEGKKWHQQFAEYLSMLQDMLECSIDTHPGEAQCLLPDPDDNNHKRKHAVSEEIAMRHFNIPNEKQKRLECNGIGETIAYPDDSRPSNNVTGISHACSEENGDDWRSFELADFNCHKLLYLDNPLDEESYRVASERPLSPTLPEIGSLSIGTNGMDNDGVLVRPMKVVSPIRNDNMVPSCSPDVSSNPERASKYFRGYYVIFSDINSNSSISKIFSATRTCLAQCSMLSQIDHMVQVTLSTLLKVKDLLSREKVCVFFSLLVGRFPEFALDNFTHPTDGDMIISFESFARQMRSVMDDIETRNIFEESLKLDELVSIIEDFLIHRRVLVHRNVSSGSLPEPDPIGDIVMDGGDLSFQAASDQQLVGASVVLASICTAVDHIGFVCETSYNMLRMQRIDSSMLAILHVFAYISGSKYFTNNDYILPMMVIKSLVMFLEKEMSSTELTSCSQRLTAVQLGFPLCKACPYSESAVPMDVVVSVLMKKLHNYVLSDVSCKGLMEAIVSLNSEPSDISDNMPASSKTVSYISLSYLGDVLSLFELVASNMNWSWSFKNIVIKLMELLDSCDIEKFMPAILVLLGQLGRLGVDANGYDDTGVETIRGRLSSFLCRSTSSFTVLPTQIATVTALLGVVPVRFEEIIKINQELPEVVNDSCPADCIRKWFSLLSKEEQSLTTRVLVAGVPSSGSR